MSSPYSDENKSLDEINRSIELWEEAETTSSKQLEYWRLKYLRSTRRLKSLRKAKERLRNEKI